MTDVALREYLERLIAELGRRVDQRFEAQEEAHMRTIKDEGQP